MDHGRHSNCESRRSWSDGLTTPKAVYAENTYYEPPSATNTTRRRRSRSACCRIEPETATKGKIRDTYDQGRVSQVVALISAFGNDPMLRPPFRLAQAGDTSGQVGNELP